MNTCYLLTIDEVLKGDFDMASHPFDALVHASGPWLYKVNQSGRRIDATCIDATELLREFARWCALQVIDEWDASDVVRKYLETGDQSLNEEVGSEAKRAAEKAWWEEEATGEEADARAWAAKGWAAEATAAAARAARAYTAEATAAAARAARVVGVVEAEQQTKFKEMVDKAFGD